MAEQFDTAMGGGGF